MTRNADGRDPYADLDVVYEQETHRGLSPRAGRVVPRKSDVGTAQDGTDLTGLGGRAGKPGYPKD